MILYDKNDFVEKIDAVNFSTLIRLLLVLMGIQASEQLLVVI